jgi:enediyne biosynthesis protein E4
MTQMREISGGGSYLSQSDLRAHFGLGKATTVESVEVVWPSGSTQVFRDLAVDKFYIIEEGKPLKK